MTAQKRVLVYVEDPGACNYLRDVPGRLSAACASAVLICSGAAVGYLSGGGAPFDTVQSDDSAAQILDRYNPDIVIVGTSEQANSLSLRLIDECKTRKIISVAAVDMESNADRRFRGETDAPLAHAPEQLLVPDASCKSEFVKLGFPEERIVIAGHPHYDYVASKAAHLSKQHVPLRQRLLPGVTADRKVITFVCEGWDLLDRSASLRTADYTLYGRGANDFRTAIVLEELIDALQLINPRPYLVARLHPKMRGDELEDYFGEVDLVSVNENPLELLTASDVVVGMSSMLLQEAAIIGKPTLSILPRAVEKKWLPFITSGYIPMVDTRSALRNALADFLNSDGAAPIAAVPSFQTESLGYITDFVCALLSGISKR